MALTDKLHLKKDGEVKVFRVFGIDRLSQDSDTQKNSFIVRALFLDEKGNQVFVSMNLDSFPRTKEAKIAMENFVSSPKADTLVKSKIQSVFKVDTGGKLDSTKKATQGRRSSKRKSSRILHSQSKASEMRKKMNNFKLGDQL